MKYFVSQISGLVVEPVVTDQWSRVSFELYKLLNFREQTEWVLTLVSGSVFT